MHTFISVIYVNYNCSNLTIASIGSLETHCKDVSFEVIIVDNASKVEEKHVLDLWAGQNPAKNVKTIWAEQNLGFGKANNLGASHATGKFLFFLNPDTLICNDVLSIFSEFLETSAPSIVACGGKLLTAEKEPTASYGNFPGVLQELGNIGLGLSFILGRHYQSRIAINSVTHQKAPAKVPYIVGADIFIYADTFNNLYGFDESFFMYYEETDLFFRLSRKGLDSYIVPAAEIIHLEGGAIKALSKESFNHKKFEMLLASKLNYYQKWSTGFLLPFIKLIFLLQIVIQFLKGRMGGKLSPLLESYFSIVFKVKMNSTSAF
ncbi:MAG: glycosyltransferase family 2 protein [Imperialibacter sp.]|uniref:glycosyltransferase family 2 protein n=1 Tax=Imperialibacter sp. TaxID=2038411 RepID=UPI0030D90267